MPKKEAAPAKTRKRSLEATGFYSDASRDGMLYAVLVRSPAATGKVKGVTIPELPEGYFLFTADDIPGNKKAEINGQSWKIFGYDNVISCTGENLLVFFAARMKTKSLNFLKLFPLTLTLNRLSLL